MGAGIERLWTRDFILIWAAHFLMSLAFHATMPVFPLLLQDRFGLVGWVLGAGAASYTLSAIIVRPPAGYWLDKFGRKLVYLPAFGVFSLIYLIYPLTDGAVSVILVRFFHGAAWGIVMGAANTAAVDLLPAKRRGEGIGYFGLSMICSMAAGPGVGLYIADLFGFDALFGGASLLTLLGFFAACFLRFPSIPRNLQPFSWGALFERTSLPASLAVLLFCIPFGAINNYSGLFSRSVPGASTGVFFFFLALGTGITRLFSGRIFDRGGPALIMCYGYAFLLVGCGLMVVSGIHSAWGAMCFSVAGLCIGMGFGITVPIIMAMINALVLPQRRGAANSTLMTAFDLGICCGLLVTSPIYAHTGLSVTYLVLSGCICLSALVFVFVVLPRYSRTLLDLAGKGG